MSRAHRSSPLSVWLLALVLVLPISAPLLIPSVEINPTGIEAQNENRYRRELAEYLGPAPGERERPMGVMLTASGGICATEGPRRLSPDGVEMYVAYYSSATISDFQGLTDILIRTKPDFIVIQDIVVTRSTSPIQRLYERARLNWKNRIDNFTRWTNAGNVGQDYQNNQSCRPKSLQQTAWTSVVSRIMANASPYSDSKQRTSVEFLANFSEANIPVLITSPPTNNFTADYRLEMFRNLSALVSQNDSTSGVSLHRQSGLTPATQFADPFHIWPSENEAYRTWLDSEIRRVLGARDY